MSAVDDLNRPLVTVVEAMRDLGRAYRDDQDGDWYSEIIELAKRAHAALMWMEADERQDIPAAQDWLDIVYGRTSTDVQA